MHSRSKYRYAGNVKAKKPWEEYLNECRAKIKEMRNKTVDTHSLAAQFVHLRRKRKCSQKEMADLLSVNQSLISRIENGWNRISLDTLMKISKGLGVKIVISAHSITLITNK
ncbi:helix-turn-helix domain-containing protein [Sporolactobacillus pectinivorans]|uniref:helix-turn-helix domain-containing protein n=1 Tax=Sporolactobacillus pectinivorans TaxID=1591408 RepID=UPI000C25E6C7|nr:helix-turn-helix transcriptional regulator [Sporolactobacillus pectinivorans]